MVATAQQEPLPSFSGVALSCAFARELPELAIAWQAAPAPRPELVMLNEQVAVELGLDLDRLRTPQGVEFLIGRALAEGSEPVAQLYSGHQFGSYSPMLGDGRALLLGEISTPGGDVVDVHLKGSGPTPPSRGDGFAALGPMLREYLVSEAMHALGVPTTRALAVVATGRVVMRDDFLRDNQLPGAVLTRVAASHLRVGTFQLARARGDIEVLRRLVAVALGRHYPDLPSDPELPPALALFRATVRAQAELVAKWMLVGFVHGVMNTDNMTISGETIDYGPCAFIDAYDPSAVFSSIDRAGRYAFGRQASIARWNLARFAEALMPLIAEQDGGEAAIALAKRELEAFDRQFTREITRGMAAKLGVPDAADSEVRSLAEELLALLAEGGVDYTIAFRRLTDAAAGERITATVTTLLAGPTSENLVRAVDWLEKWQTFGPQRAVMQAVNPIYIPRNHLVDEALEAATDGNMGPFVDLLAVVRDPLREHEQRARYALPAPAGSTPFVSFCGT